MTTTVIVRANHGWPVSVTAVAVPSGERTAAPTVGAGEERTFCVHSGQDLLIHEIQPSDYSDNQMSGSSAPASGLVEIGMKVGLTPKCGPDISSASDLSEKSGWAAQALRPECQGSGYAS